MLERAKSFAIKAHGNQVRKYTGEPYWHHCKEVAFLVSMVGGTDAMIAAAWLHDVCEDTDVPIATINAIFGPVVAKYVDDMTDKATVGNRATRKTADRHRWTQCAIASHTIKVADLLSNSVSIIRYDKDFAKIYIKEKQDLLPYLCGANLTLFAAANQMIKRYYDGIQGKSRHDGPKQIDAIHEQHEKTSDEPSGQDCGTDPLSRIHPTNPG